MYVSFHMNNECMDNEWYYYYIANIHKSIYVYIYIGVYHLLAMKIFARLWDRMHHQHESSPVRSQRYFFATKRMGETLEIMG